MATIVDVAREAGVSTATVSRILNNSPKVQPETRDRVMRVIHQMGYAPNRLAQQFRTQETGIILVLVPELGNTFYSEIISGIESVAQKNHYHIMVSQIHNQAETEEYFFERLSQKQVDGIITFSAIVDPGKLESMAAQFPIVVACRYYEGMQVPNVTIDNEKASRDMTTYLLNLGHRKICCLAGDTNILLYQDRLKGFQEAMKQRGLTVLPEMICESDPGIQGGYTAIEKLMNNGAQFTAVVACGDTLAIGAIKALRDMKLRVPEDIAVTGFDDIELSSLYRPTLTTVRQPKTDIGVRAAEKLLDLIAEKTLANPQEVLHYELVIRESSGEFIG